MSGIIGGAGSKSGIIGDTELDYEEGTWTASISGAGGVGPYGLSYTTAYYRKIGGVVHITWDVPLASIGSSSGDATVTGLPYTASNVGFFFMSYGSAVDGTTRGGYISGTTMYWTDQDALTMASWKDLSTSKWKVHGSYFTDA